MSKMQKVMCYDKNKLSVLVNTDVPVPTFKDLRQNWCKYNPTCSGGHTPVVTVSQ